MLATRAISPLASRVGLPISRVISAARSSARSLYSSATRSKILARSSFALVRQDRNAWAERSSTCPTSPSVAVANSRSVSFVAGLTTLYSLTLNPSGFALNHDSHRAVPPIQRTSPSRRSVVGDSYPTIGHHRANGAPPGARNGRPAPPRTTAHLR